MVENGGCRPAGPVVSDIGEFGLIERLTRGRPSAGDRVSVGPGDDAAVVAFSDGRAVISTDMLMQDRHFRLDWSSPADIGTKAIAQNGADIAAMGAVCTGFVVALGLPPQTPVATVERLYEGMWAEAERAGAPVVGGDIVSAPVLVISVTVFGSLDGRAPVLRSGARTGDVVAVNAETGWSAAGLALLERGFERSGGAAERSGGAIDRHRRPRPDYGSAVVAARAGATAMIDTSDGLLSEVGHIAAASTVAIDLSGQALMPAPELLDVAAEVGVDAAEWVLAGGEDHALVATFPPGTVPPAPWRTIGEVVPADHGPRITIDGAPATTAAGWTSFRTTGPDRVNRTAREDQSAREEQWSP